MFGNSVVTEFITYQFAKRNTSMITCHIWHLLTLTIPVDIGGTGPDFQNEKEIKSQNFNAYYP